jgi:hypothetical protein
VSRKPPPRESPLGTKLLLFALANALPLGTVAALLVLANRGEVRFRPLPEEGVGLLGLLAAVLAGIVALGWGAAPVLSYFLRGARGRFEATLEGARRAGAAGKLARAPAIVLLGIVVGFLYVDVVLLAACVLGLLAAEIDICITLALRLRS